MQLSLKKDPRSQIAAQSLAQGSKPGHTVAYRRSRNVARTKLLTAKYPKSAARAANSQKWWTVSASAVPVPAVCRRHAPPTIVRARMAKNRPVTRSHSALENVASGAQRDRLAFRVMFCREEDVGCFCFDDGALGSGRKESERLAGAAPTSDGFACDGSGAVAASATAASVLAACRVPYPRARPKRTLSTSSVYPGTSR